MNQPNMNGLRVFRLPNAVAKRGPDTILIPLPRALWRLCGDDGHCMCATCVRTGRAAYWDTMAVTSRKPRDGRDYTWTCHNPETHAYDTVELVCEGHSIHTTSLEWMNGKPARGRWSVLIPWSSTPTQWHPTEPTGPLSTLVRGNWRTEAELIKWCEAHIPGHPYKKRFTVDADDETNDTGAGVTGAPDATTGPDGLAVSSGPSPKWPADDASNFNAWRNQYRGDE